MLKGLLLSGGLVAIWVVVQGVVFHVAAPRKAFSSMVASFAPTVPIYLLLYSVAPADLGLLPPGFVGADWRLGLGNGLLVHVLLSSPPDCSTPTRTGRSRSASSSSWRGPRSSA